MTFYVDVSILTRSCDRVRPDTSQVVFLDIQFQSSPDPATGCDWVTPRLSASAYCFNPHPILRPGATRAVGSTPPAPRGFNPHPILRPGATARHRHVLAGHHVVSILTRSCDRVRPASAAPGGPSSAPFQSSPDPATGCDLQPSGVRRKPVAVSILTRSCDRVRPGNAAFWFTAKQVFQSSPDPATGCDARRPHPLRHRPPRVSILTRSCDRVRRPRRRGRSLGLLLVFQSSPDPATGCDARAAVVAAWALEDVSILTRSCDRVRPADVTRAKIDAVVSILTRSCDRVRLWVAPPTSAQPIGFQSSPDPATGCDVVSLVVLPPVASFNPHPILRPGATVHPVAEASQGTSFNPHPILRPGATRPR